MLIKKFVNTIFNSNTYLLFKIEEKKVWVIDPGSNTNQLIQWIENNKKTIGGVLLTHTHFDHIYGLNDLQKKYPEVAVFGSIYAKDGMISEKLNGSLYIGTPFVIKHPDYNVIKDNDQVFLWNNTYLNVIETPGHDRDCLTFQIGNNLFTGDALISGIKVHTKLKYSDKILAANSIKKILEQFDGNTMIWPGHENECKLKHLIVVK